jgi:hypothetical protein
MLDFGSVTAGGIVSTVLRSAVVYLTIYVALRLAGKRHVGQLSIAGRPAAAVSSPANEGVSREAEGVRRSPTPHGSAPDA